MKKKVIPSSPELLSFYVAWLNAAQEHPYGDMRVQDSGLCSNLRHFCYKKGFPGSLGDELRGQFLLAGLDVNYPFCGRSDYCDEVLSDRAHLNEARVQWVRDRIVDGRGTRLQRIKLRIFKVLSLWAC